MYHESILLVCYWTYTYKFMAIVYGYHVSICICVWIHIRVCVYACVHMCIICVCVTCPILHISLPRDTIGNFNFGPVRVHTYVYVCACVCKHLSLIERYLATNLPMELYSHELSKYVRWKIKHSLEYMKTIFVVVVGVKFQKVKTVATDFKPNPLLISGSKFFIAFCTVHHPC